MIYTAQEGLERANFLLNVPSAITGNMFDEEKAVGELMMMASELEELIYRQMSNVPDPVVRALNILWMAVGTLAVIARKRQLEGKGS